MSLPTNVIDISVAELLMFEAWPDEMQRLARAAVYAEIEEGFDEQLEAMRHAAIGDQEDADQHKYDLVLKRTEKARALIDAALDTLDQGGEDAAHDAGVDLKQAAELLGDLDTTLANVEEEE